VKFKPLGDYSDSDSESELETDKKFTYPPPQRPWVPKGLGSSPSLSDVTLYDTDDEVIKDKPGLKRISEIENYSDVEGEDITSSNASPLGRVRSRREEPGWTPAFLQRGTDSTSHGKGTTSSPPPGAVPMTPSLIRAIDRIAVAQTKAYRAAVPLSPQPTETREEWRGFWERVQQKAAES